MAYNSVPSSPTSINSIKSQPFSFKLTRGKKFDANKKMLTVSQKVIDASGKFEKGRVECLKKIENNQKMLEKELKRNSELKNEFEKMLMSGYASLKSSVRIENDGSMVEYYKNKLEEIEKLAETQKKEYDQMIRAQEAENKMMKQRIGIKE